MSPGNVTWRTFYLFFYPILFKNTFKNLVKRFFYFVQRKGLLIQNRVVADSADQFQYHVHHQFRVLVCVSGFYQELLINGIYSRNVFVWCFNK